MLSLIENALKYYEAKSDMQLENLPRKPRQINVAIIDRKTRAISPSRRTLQSLTVTPSHTQWQHGLKEKPCSGYKTILEGKFPSLARLGRGCTKCHSPYLLYGSELCDA